jgi:hypothetical protein
LTYHLMVLEQSRRIKVNRYAARKSKDPTALESQITARRTTYRKILLFLLDHDRCRCDDIIHTKK